MYGLDKMQRKVSPSLLLDNFMKNKKSSSQSNLKLALKEKLKEKLMISTAEQ